MAGRPVKMAEKTTALEARALQLSYDVFCERPKQYLDRPTADPICVAWNDAVSATMLAMTATEKLGNLLRAKANITEPGLNEKITLADGKPYEPPPKEWSLAEACAGVPTRLEMGVSSERMSLGRRNGDNSNGDDMDLQSRRDSRLLP